MIKLSESKELAQKKVAASFCPECGAVLAIKQFDQKKNKGRAIFRHPKSENCTVRIVKTYHRY